MTSLEFVRDVLGEPYEAATIRLADDDEGAVVATLVRRKGPPARRPTRRAALYLHGFSDYFFQTHLATFYTARGFDFYALDLRKYGRSLLGHQTPNHTTSLAVYAEEIDEAVRFIREVDGHDVLVLSGHSTGGLVAALWAHHRRGRGLVDGLVLNSPFFDLNSAVQARVGDTVRLFGGRRPYRVVPLPPAPGYGQSLHRDHHGEWDYNVAWKPHGGFPVYAGWLAAVRAGHRMVRAGLAIDCPVLVMASSATCTSREWCAELSRADGVLNADRIAELTPRLGRHTTCVRVRDGLHDLLLSAAPVREQAFCEMERWLAAYLPG